MFEILAPSVVIVKPVDEVPGPVALVDDSDEAMLLDNAHWDNLAEEARAYEGMMAGLYD